MKIVHAVCKWLTCSKVCAKFLHCPAVVVLDFEAVARVHCKETHLQLKRTWNLN